MVRKSKFRRRRFRPLRWLFRLAFTLCLLWLAGFAIFAFAVSRAAPPNPMPHADGIVAFTGGDGRVSTALGLLADRDAPALLISGAGRGTYLGDFTADDTLAATNYAGVITLGHNAVTTHGNALETAAWAQARHMGSLIVVTADYHMPRAILELRASLPGVTFYQVPVRPPAMSALNSLSTWHLLASEYTKYLAVRFETLAAGVA